MLDPVAAGPLRLELGELAEVVAEALDAAAVEPGPERRLAHRHAAHQGQPLVVVGGPRDHVDVRVDVVHGQCRKSNVESQMSLSLSNVERQMSNYQVN